MSDLEPFAGSIFAEPDHIGKANEKGLFKTLLSSAATLLTVSPFSKLPIIRVGRQIGYIFIQS
jgi:hypothetical protein